MYLQIGQIDYTLQCTFKCKFGIKLNVLSLQFYLLRSIVWLLVYHGIYYNTD